MDRGTGSPSPAIKCLQEDEHSSAVDDFSICRVNERPPPFIRGSDRSHNFGEIDRSKASGEQLEGWSILVESGPEVAENSDEF